MVFFIDSTQDTEVIFCQGKRLPRMAVFEVVMWGGSWSSFSGRENIELTSEWKTFEYRFTARRNDGRARFEINLGDSTETAYVKDVIIREKEGRKN